MAIDNGVAIREVLGHQYHRFVTGRVAVRMIFADDIANCPRRLFGFLPCRQSEFAHRINNAALYGLQAVADLRQRAVEDDVHGVVEIRFLRELL